MTSSRQIKVPFFKNSRKYVPFSFTQKGVNDVSVLELSGDFYDWKTSSRMNWNFMICTARIDIAVDITAFKNQ